MWSDLGISEIWHAELPFLTTCVPLFSVQFCHCIVLSMGSPARSRWSREPRYPDRPKCATRMFTQSSNCDGRVTYAYGHVPIE